MKKMAGLSRKVQDLVAKLTTTKTKKQKQNKAKTKQKAIAITITITITITSLRQRMQLHGATSLNSWFLSLLFGLSCLSALSCK